MERDAFSDGKNDKTALKERIVALLANYKQNLPKEALNNLLGELDNYHREMERKTHLLEERTKELSLFYHLFNLEFQENISESEFLQTITEQIPEAWQYPEITCARIQFDTNEFKTKNFKKTPWKQSVGILINDENRGSIEVFYLEEKPEMDEGPFLKEERNLIDAVALNVKRYLERQQAVKTLIYNEILLREMGSVAKIGGWEFDPVTGKGTWTEETARIHDMDPEKETNMELGISFYSDDSKRKITQAVQNAIENKKTYDLELELISAKGIHKWVRTIGKPIVENGKVIKVRGSFQDITEFKKQQQLLTEKEENLRITLDSIGDAVIATDTNGFLTRMNPVAETLTGWNFQDTASKKIEEIFHIVNAHTGEKVENPVHKILLNGRIVGLANHTKLISKNGEEYQIADSGAPIKNNLGKIIGVVLVFRDVTEEYKTVQALKESEQKYKTLIEISQDALFINFNNKISYLNPAALKLFGAKTMEQLIGKSPLEVFHPNYHDIIKSRIRTMYEEATPVSLEEEKIIRLDGAVVDVEVTATPFQLEGKTAIQVVLRDISKRKTAETKLKESEERFRNLFETMAEGVVYQNAKGEIIDANLAAQKILGLSLEQMKGKTSINPLWKAIDQDKKELPGNKHTAMVALRTGKSVKNKLQGIFNPERNDYVWIIVNSVPLIKEESEKPFQVYSTFLDITERKNAEDALLHLKDNLQKDVELKTRELRERIAELERFQQATMEREFRIKELKDEIKSLKNNIRNADDE